MEFKFLGLLKNQIKLDKEVEIQKEILFSNTAYNSYEAFRLFDTQNRGYVSEQDLQQAFEAMNLNASVAQLISRYDKDQDGNLSFHEFQKAVTPKNRSYITSLSASGSGSLY
jgi:Ca2+-binding EF-hand superfamily protein